MKKIFTSAAVAALATLTACKAETDEATVGTEVEATAAASDAATEVETVNAE